MNKYIYYIYSSCIGIINVILNNEIECKIGQFIHNHTIQIFFLYRMKNLICMYENNGQWVGINQSI